MLNTVKKALRINHNALDDDILMNIETACTDAVRAGVPVEVMTDYTNPLVCSLIKTYCLYAYADKDNSQRYYDSYTYQLENLRKSRSLLVLGGVE